MSRYYKICIECISWEAIYFVGCTTHGYWHNNHDMFCRSWVWKFEGGEVLRYHFQNIWHTFNIWYFIDKPSINYVISLKCKKYPFDWWYTPSNLYENCSTILDCDFLAVCYSYARICGFHVTDRCRLISVHIGCMAPALIII